MVGGGFLGCFSRVTQLISAISCNSQQPLLIIQLSELKGTMREP